MLRVCVLGEIALEADGGRLEPPARRSGRLLLAYLALNPGLHARGDVAGLFWPDVHPDSARSSLRAAIAAVRAALGEHADSYLIATRDRIGLAGPDLVHVDALAFEQLVADGRAGEALDVAGPELLQGLDETWVLEAREEHRLRLRALLAGRAGEEEEAGDLPAAIELTRREVALDPLSESSTRELMRRLALVGDRAAALDAYRRLQGRLRQELGAPPSRSTRAMAEALRATEHAEGADGSATPSPVLPPPAVTDDDTAPFVGRGDVLEELAGARAAFLAGEPGIGKTRLLQELAQRAAAEGARVLWGRCHIPGAPSYQPLVEALRGYVRDAPAAELSRALPPIAGELVALMPELRDRVDLPAPLEDDANGGDERLFRALLETLPALASGGRALLVIDDLHASDDGTLRLLEHLIAGPNARGMSLALGYRDREAPDALRRFVARARRVAGTVDVALKGLDAEAVAALAGERGEAAEVLWRRTGGNPLFVTALLGRPGRAGAGGGEPRLPERVSDLVEEELARLDKPVRATLAIASAIGDEFCFELTAAVAGGDEQAVLDALDEAVAARIARERGPAGSYSFRHPLMREVIYASLTATRRAHLHMRIAEAVDARDAPARLVAEHVIRAGELVPAVRAAGVLARAAAEASEERRHRDAAGLYERAVAALDGRPAEARGRCELLVRLGEARVRAGDADVAGSAFSEAAAGARSLADGQLLAQAALGLSSLPGGAPGAAEAVAALEDAVELLPAHDHTTRALVLARLGRELAHARSFAEVERLAHEAIRSGRRSGDPVALADALDTSHALLNAHGDSGDRLALADEMIALGERHGHAGVLVRGRVRRGVGFLERGDLDAAAVECEALERLAADLRQPAYAWWAKLWRASEAILTAGAAEGERRAGDALALGRPAYGAAAELEFQAQVFWLGWQAGAIERLVAASAAQAERFVTVTPAWRCAEAAVTALAGATDRARALLDELASEKQLATLRGDAAWPVAASMLAEACAVAAYPAPAERLFGALEPLADRWAVGASGSLCICPVSRALGLLAAAMGRSADAERYFADALERANAVGATALAARIEAERGGTR
jgi:DNA-binding SARP family transcriptional activator